MGSTKILFAAWIILDAMLKGLYLGLYMYKVIAC